MTLQYTKSQRILTAIAAIWAMGVSLVLLLAPTYEISFGVYGPNTPAFYLPSALLLLLAAATVQAEPERDI
jgi:hypothetical protein